MPRIPFSKPYIAHISSPQCIKSLCVEWHSTTYISSLNWYTHSRTTHMRNSVLLCRRRRRLSTRTIHSHSRTVYTHTRSKAKQWRKIFLFYTTTIIRLHYLNANGNDGETHPYIHTHIIYTHTAACTHYFITIFINHFKIFFSLLFLA